MKILSGPNGFYRVVGLTPSLLSYVKINIPVVYRFWDHEKKYADISYWYVHEQYILNLAKLARKENLAVEAHSDLHKLRVQLEGYLSPEKDVFSVLFLQPDAPDYIVEAVWRKLAQVHHPDRGGDAEEFKRFLAAYEQIKDK